MKILNITIIFLISMVLLDKETFSQFTTFRVYPSSNNQIEPSISIHPLNPQILFASAYSVSTTGFKSEGIYVSTDGGNSWTGKDTCTGANIQNHAGDPGPIIDKNGTFIITHIGSIPPGMYANFSTDQGATWSGNAQILSGDLDKGAPGTDVSSTSPFYGRTYLAFTNFTPPFRIVLSYTSNSGTSWSSVGNVNNSAGSNRSFGPAVSTSPTGIVYVAWASSIPNSPFTEDYIGFAKSSNGGVNWTVNETAIDCNGIRTTTLTPWTIRANSFPAIDVDRTGGPRNGWIYIAVTDKNFSPAGSDPDIVIHRSTDEGNTWSSGVRVNQDQINNGRNQFFPALRVDENGGVNIIYYDSRGTPDSVDVYLSRSMDGGSSWTDYRVTNNRFRPASISGSGGAGNMGDNLGMTSGNGKLYPVWMSNITGLSQIWSAVIDYNTIGIQQIGSEIPKQYGLSQNYPNPFNPVTKIKFQIAHSGAAKIIIYDALGKEITTLVDQQVKAGTYEASWDASASPSGVYFYKLLTEGYSETRKMVLTK
jgi:hypothetical protein